MTVIQLPGAAYVPRQDDWVSPKDCLQSAMDAGLRDVVIVGRMISGAIVLWSSQPDADTAIGLLHRGINRISEAEQVAPEPDQV